MGAKSHVKPQIQPNYLNGVPYDYFVVVDAGSHGSRVYVYSWLNPYEAMTKKADFLLKEYSKVLEVESDTDSDSDNDTGNPKSKTRKLKSHKTPPKFKRKSKSHSNSNRHVNFPVVFSLKDWHKVEHVGLATLHDSPESLDQHVKSLLRLASDVVPKSQHYRTPMFVHATAGMRLLPEDQQQTVLLAVCNILQHDSDFYVPDCASHVNIIDGETEGLYGWLALNYLKKFVPDSTYGFLDMGGMSTQVVFQPNKTEAEKHRENLYNVSLAHLPLFNKKTLYSAPQVSSYEVSTRSFLGLGESEAHRKYLAILALKDAGVLKIVEDPCSAKGYHHRREFNGTSVEFSGSGDFEKCIVSIFSVFSEYYKPHGEVEDGSDSSESSDCHDITSEDRISSCLASSAHPAFDFKNDKFVGVSEYKRAVSDLQELGYIGKKKGHTYNYEDFHAATKKVCSLDRKQLEKLTSRKEQSELSKLCFQSSWILNVLHVGFGFPNVNVGTDGPKLELEERIDGHKFSWSLGRAFLYANDEYVQAFNSYSGAAGIDRPGFQPKQDAFVFGAEGGHFIRPRFEAPLASATYKYFDYESSYEKKLLPWVQLLLLAMMILAMIGLYRGGFRQVASFYGDITRAVRQAKYTVLEQEVEMSEYPESLGDEEQFTVSSDLEEV